MTEDEIAESYERQAGTYVAAMENKDYAALKIKVGKKLAGILDELKPKVLLDAGTGEGTTLAATLLAMEHRPEKVMAFDIVPQRIAFAKQYLANYGLEVELFGSPMSKIPLPDKSVDVVMTYHAIEPNGGHETEILDELVRVCCGHLVLVEPCREMANLEARERMNKLGYAIILNRLPSSKCINVNVEAWGLDINPLNPAGLFVVECSRHV